MFLVGSTRVGMPWGPPTTGRGGGGCLVSEIPSLSLLPAHLFPPPVHPTSMLQLFVVSLAAGLNTATIHIIMYHFKLIFG